jgi:hypothetical protein
MRCIICEKEFIAMRSDARFCSVTCRKRASRSQSSEDICDTPPKVTPVSETVTDNLTPDGQVRQIWDKENKIKNLEGGYLHIGQTQEEYIENIPEVGFLWGGNLCPHPITEIFHSRCLQCMAVIQIVRADKAPLLKGK